MNTKSFTLFLARLCFAGVAVVGLVLLVSSFRDTLSAARDVSQFYQLNNRIERDGMPEGELLTKSYEGACTSGANLVKSFQSLNNRIYRLALVMILLSLVGLASIQKGVETTAQPSPPAYSSKAADGLTGNAER
jgi:hypothetical protein